MDGKDIGFPQAFFLFFFVRTVLTPSPLINIMAKACLKASPVIIRDFGEMSYLQSSRGGVRQFASFTKRNVERSIYNTLLSTYPHHNFLLESGEKKSENTDDAPVWIISVLDGEKNFLHNIPHFSFSLAVQEHGEIIAGMVYDPLKDDLFWAHKGMGSFLNQQRIRVSSRTSVPEAFLGTSAYSGSGLSWEKVSQLEKLVAGIRFLGCPSLDCAYVAAGRFDGIWMNKMKPWNIAAGIILIKEAGGFISDAQGGTDMLKDGTMVAGNEKIYHLLRKELS